MISIDSDRQRKWTCISQTFYLFFFAKANKCRLRVDARPCLLYEIASVLETLGSLGTSISKSRRLKASLNKEQKCAILGTSHHDWMSTNISAPFLGVLFLFSFTIRLRGRCDRFYWVGTTFFKFTFLSNSSSLVLQEQVYKSLF